MHVAPGLRRLREWRQPVTGDQHAIESGTSMAAPHVAGAAALVLQDHPHWTGPQVSSALASAAHPLKGYAPTDDGAGRLDIAASDDATVLPTPWTARLGLGSALRSVAGDRVTVVLHRMDGASVRAQVRRVGADFVELWVSEHAESWKAGEDGHLEVVPFAWVAALSRA